MISKIYNLIASCIRELIDYDDDRIFEKYDTIGLAARNHIDEKLVNEIPALFDHAVIVEIDAIKDQDTCINQIQQYVDRHKGKTKTNDMIALLEALDDSLIKRLEAMSNMSKDISLNDNEQLVEISLFPRFQCNWERSSRGKTYYNRIDSFIKNILVVDTRKLKKYDVHHVYVQRNLLQKDKELIFGLCPFKKDAQLKVDYYETPDQLLFSVENIGDYQEDNAAIVDRIKEAGKNNVDILMFPEMLGNIETVEYVKTFLRNNAFDGGKVPDVIVLPSVWNNHTNIATMLDRSGREICSQPKRRGYKQEIKEQHITPESFLGKEYIGKNALENLEDNNEIYVIHCRGVGRMSIVICKDYLGIDDIQMLVKELKLTLLLVPSYSTGSHDFRLDDFSKINDCCIVWLNTCAAMEKLINFENIGYIVKAGNHRNKGDQFRYDIKCDQCLENNQCDRLCMYYGSIQMGQYA